MKPLLTLYGPRAVLYKHEQAEGVSMPAWVLSEVCEWWQQYQRLFRQHWQTANRAERRAHLFETVPLLPKASNNCIPHAACFKFSFTLLLCTRPDLIRGLA